MIRITADYDFKNRLKLVLNFFKVLITVKKIKYIELRPSAHKGWHIEVWSTEKYTVKQKYELRLKIGDDPSRVRLDKKRKIGRDTLFFKKTKHL